MTKPDPTPDERLAALFATELPPARDAGFQAEVLEAVARRRFAADMLLLSTVTSMAGAGLWLVWPALAPTLEALGQGLAPGLTAVIAAGSIVALTTGRILSPRS
jgi:hypothetical protein